MTMKLKRLGLLVGVVFLAVSCITDERVTGGPGKSDDPQADDGMATFTVDLPATQTVRTRSVGSRDENTIETLYLVLYADGGENDLVDLIDCSPSLKVHPDAVDKNRWQFKARIPQGRYNLYLVANVTKTLIDKLKTDPSIDHIGELYFENTGKWDITETPIPMYDQKLWHTVGENYAGTSFRLGRAMAKINVDVAESADDDFTLSDIYFMNYNTESFVAPGMGYRTESRVSGLEKEIGYDENEKFYVFEAANVAEYGETGWQTNPCLIVKGSYGGHTDSYYRLDFVGKSTEEGSEGDDLWMSVTRNYSYQFSITSVSGDGYGTIEDAYNSRPANMEVSVIDWNDAEMGEVIIEGGNYFRIDRHEVIFSPMKDITETVTIRTSIADFSLTCGETTLQIGDTHQSAYYTYSLKKDTARAETYTLTITTKSHNVSDEATPSRLEEWTIDASRLWTLSLSVDQEWTTTYISVMNGQVEHLFPEGTNNIPIPIEIVSTVPVDIDVVGNMDWITVKNADNGTPATIGDLNTPSGGIYYAHWELSVNPYQFAEGIKDRMVTITVTPTEGDDRVPRKLSIIQEAPYLTIIPVNTLIPLPQVAADYKMTTTPVQIQTNLRKEYINVTLGGASGEGANRLTLPTTNLDNLLSSANISSRPRYLKFDINVDLTSYPNFFPVIGFGRAFTVSQKSGTGFDYKVPVRPGNVTVAQGNPEGRFYWRAIRYLALSPVVNPWSVYSETYNQEYYFPWTAAEADFTTRSNQGHEYVSNPGPDGENGGEYKFVSSSLSQGIATANHTFKFLNDKNLSESRDFSLVFVPKLADIDPINVTFHQSGQNWNTGTTGFDQTYGYLGTMGTTPAYDSFGVTSDINWRAIASDDWVKLSLTTTFPSTIPSSVTRNDRPASGAPSTTPGWMRSGNVNVQLARWTELNPKASDGVTPLTTRTANIRFESLDATHPASGGVNGISPDPITITQYAPMLILDEVATEAGSVNPFPAGNGPDEVREISDDTRTITIHADANIGWSIKLYTAATGLSTLAPEAITPYVVSVTDNAGDVKPTTVTFTIPAHVSAAADRDLYLYITPASSGISASRTSGEIPVAHFRQMVSPSPGIKATAGVIGYYADGEPRLTLDGDPSLNGGIGTRTVYVAYFKWASLVATSSHHTYTTFSSDNVVWAPEDYVYDGSTGTEALKKRIGDATGQTAWDIVPYRNRVEAQSSWYPWQSNDMDGFQGALGDPCEITDSGTGWRMPTLADSQRYINGTASSSSQPAGSDYYKISGSWNRSDPGMGTFPMGQDQGGSRTLPAAGWRGGNGNLVSYGSEGWYYSSTTSSNNDAGRAFSFSSSEARTSTYHAAYTPAYAVRCVRIE